MTQSALASTPAGGRGDALGPNESNAELLPDALSSLAAEQNAPTGSSASARDARTPVAALQPTYSLESTAADGEEKFARILTDVPVMLGGRGGVTIGYLRRGTRVKLASLPELGAIGMWAPFPAVNRFGGISSSAVERESKTPLYVSIEIKTSAEMRAKLDRYRGVGGSARSHFGLYRELSYTQAGSPFAFVQCGKVRELEQKGNRLHVIAEYEAGELEGWVDAAKADERDAACDFGAHQTLPHGYLVTDAQAGETLVQLAAAKAELFLRPKKGELSRCERWVFSPAKDPASGWLVVDDGSAVDNTGTHTERSYGVVGNVLNLGGLVYKQKGAAVVAGGKVDFFAILRADAESLSVMEWEPHREGRETRLLGYRATAAKTWYLNRSACESTGSKMPSNKGGAAPSNNAAPESLK